MEKVCENCKNWKLRPATGLHMDGTADVYGSCMVLRNDVCFRGATKPDFTCIDFEAGVFNEEEFRRQRQRDRLDQITSPIYFEEKD
jgi:hypothetical protein